MRFVSLITPPFTRADQLLKVVVAGEEVVVRPQSYLSGVEVLVLVEGWFSQV